ncbi:MAG TPA: hypothetical protein VNO79_12230 [Actinomycetota bacterium]|nr:hypothetical protein [Actinomycetota bacterium]
MSRPPEHWHSGAAPCYICGGASDRLRGPSGDGEAALAFEAILAARWPELSAEERHERFAEGVWNPSRKRLVPHYAAVVIPGLEERPTEDLAGLARAGEVRPARPEPGALPEAARRALSGGGETG